MALSDLAKYGGLVANPALPTIGQQSASGLGGQQSAVRLTAGGTPGFDMTGGQSSFTPATATTGPAPTTRTGVGLVNAPGMYLQQSPQTQPQTAPTTQAPAGSDAVQQAQFREYTPTYREVQENETSIGQLQAIMAEDSPLLKRARAKAAESMQSRGLLNSSMALGAAEGAMWDAAQPYAINDANTYAAASRDNQAASNEANRFNAEQFGLTSRFNVGEGNRRGDINVNNRAAMERQQAGDTAAMERLKVSEAGAMDRLKISEAGATQRAEAANATSRANAALAADVSRYTANLSAETQRSIAEYQSQTAILRDNNQMAFEANQRYLDRVQQINMNPDLDGPTRQAMVDNLTQGLQRSDTISAAVSNIPLAVR